MQLENWLEWFADELCGQQLNHRIRELSGIQRLGEVGITAQLLKG